MDDPREEDQAHELEGWVPAFPGQRPPFQPGHELSVQHGAFSPRKVDPPAADLVASVLDDDALAYLRAPRWRLALWAWARAEAQAQLLTEFLATKAETAGDGVGDLGDERVRSAYLLLHRAETRAITQRARLGLDPLSAARLGRDRTAAALDAAQLMARLEQAERERETREAGLGGRGPGPEGSGSGVMPEGRESGAERGDDDE